MDKQNSYFSNFGKTKIELCIEDCLETLKQFENDDTLDGNISMSTSTSTDSFTTFNLSSFEMGPDDLIAHLKYQKLLRLPPRSTSLNKNIF